jgi:subtilase family serine protease
MKFLALSSSQRTAATLCASMLLFLAATAQAEQHPTVATHVPGAVSSGRAVLVGHVPATQHISLAVSLPLRNESQLRNLLQRIYDPHSPDFRHYLSVQQFTDQFGPAASDYAALQRFAKTNGLQIVDTAGNRMVLDIEGPASKVESAFHVSLGLYQHPTEARTFYSTDREPAPDLDVPVLHVTGLDNFTLPKAKLVRKAPISGKTTGSGPQGQFLGSDFRAAYYGSGPLNGAGQVVGLYEQAGYEYADIKNYFEKVKQPLNVPIVGVSVNGAPLGCPAATCDDSEQSIDIEMAISMAPALDQVIVYVGTYPVSIINKMAEGGIAKQLSCSWGWSDDESRLDPIFEEMAAQGQSFFVATGDFGSASPPNYVWPGDDPLITAVGGTDLVTNGPGGSWASETGWMGSAGMPSKNGVPIPSYQQLPGVINLSNDGSTTLRNIPDVAAEANTNIYSCYDETCGGGNGGTSFAAPQWAGFTALANQQALENGEAPLGFLNPALYNIGVGSSYDSDFHDITSGSNGKYFSVTGFDLVTGWGSPNGPNLINTLAGSTSK